MAKHKPKIKVHFTDPLGEPEVMLWDLEALDVEAKIAQRIVERTPIRMDISPSQVVARACETAELLMQEVRRRGWTVAIPDPDEAREVP